MASSKKTGSSSRKSAKSKAEETKIEDAVIVESDTSTDAPAEVTADPVEDAAKIEIDEPSEAPVEETPDTKTDEPTEPEVATETVTEPDVIHPAPVVTAAPEQKSIFLPLVLGGIVAGALGYMASEYNAFGNDDTSIITELRSDLSTQQEQIAKLENAEPPVVEIPEVDLSPIEMQLTDIETRLVALEERPVAIVPDGGDGEAAAAFATELEALRAAAETQRSEIAALLNNAKSVEQATADAAKAASGQAAIAKIVSAIDAGQPFPDALATLNDLDLSEIDPALTANAETGVATLSTLQSEFPDQARTALATARASGVEEGQQGLGGFLKRSLGARSVAPREGNDPDAVLSRAEAAIKTGDLAATLAELNTLPEEAQAAIADWRAAADARVSTRNAADALAQRLTAD